VTGATLDTDARETQWTSMPHAVKLRTHIPNSRSGSAFKRIRAEKREAKAKREEVPYSRQGPPAEVNA
jgi:hypothetical protein